jgi:diguanylate cyclase (GGDEF)-like protein
MGLGRGLAALLPEPLDEDDAPVAANREPEDVKDFGAALVEQLARDESGLAVVYRSLDELVEKFELTDAALVIDEPGMGRQVFCAGRRPLDEDDELLFTLDPGVYTDPPLETDEIDAELLTNLCTVALRLDLLRYDAWHDPLTSLYDRRSFDRLLEMAVAQSRRYDWQFTLVIFDLDDFKILNDRQGHAAGDDLLRSLGERLQHTLRFGDTAARIGGDEFALILPGTDPEALPKLVERVLNGDLGTTLSYGFSVCPTEADDFDRLFKLADERLYEAKEARS